ncbi:MAG: hypothetical protein QXH87_03455 [Candidatus Bathyarchaeia archaeon]
MSNSEDLTILAEELIDFCNGLESLAVKLRVQIEKLLGVAEVKPKSSVCDAENKQWNPDKIKWQEVEGFRGKYQRYPLEDEKPESTSDYRLLLEDLKKHDGRLTRDGWFYWVFEDGCTIGRKPRKFKGKNGSEAK